MNLFEIVFSPKSEMDMMELEDVISLDYKAPLTAFHYLQGLRNAIKELSNSAESYPVQTSHSFLQYGANVRRINYKRMAIIYTTHNDIVYVHRIIASSMISD